MKNLKVYWLGILDYPLAQELQLKLVEKRSRDEITDTLLFLEHRPVITRGRGGKENNLLVEKEKLVEIGIPVFPVERGGDVTYHGPGQLVGYPILKLQGEDKDLHLLIRRYEEMIIQVLKDFGIKGERWPPHSGVWVGGKKIAAIGVAVRKWITFHGFAFNVSPDLNHFKFIVPCGIKGGEVTSLKEILGRDCPNMSEVREKTLDYFCSIWGMGMVEYEESLPELVKKENSRWA